MRPIPPLRFAPTALLILLAFLSPAFSGRVLGVSPLDEGNGRIVFAGDSITGQGGAWLGAGFCYQMEWALKQVYPEGNPILVPLGGSGMGVGNWVALEKSSQTTERTLDVKGVYVKESLAQPADALVIMLGMNDVLSPYISASDEGLERWISQYRALATALRERVKPRILAFGTITPYTETRRSFKNREIARMNEALAKLAAELGATLLPTGEACWEVLELGRQRLPDFHVTRDYIHPNPIGNQAVAIGMLRGLGESKAADALMAGRVLPAIAKQAKDAPPLSGWLEAAQEPGTFELHYWWTPPADGETGEPVARLVVPEGWEVEPAQQSGASGLFRLRGTADRLRNEVMLEIKAGETVHRLPFGIPAPWLVTGGLVQRWEQNPLEFKVKSPSNAIDKAIEEGVPFTGADLVPAEGKPPLAWQPYYASVALTGGADPGSLDYAAITDGGTFEGGYAARWIQSDRERPVTLVLGSRGLAARVHLTIWLNGEIVYADNLNAALKAKAKEPVTVPARLKKGKNVLVIRSNHTNWQWQFSANLKGEEGDDLADLRYGIKEEK